MTRKNTINRTAKFMLILFGMWPGSSCVMLRRTFWIITLTIILFWHYQYLSTRFYSDDIFDLIDCFNSFLLHLKFIIKFIVFWLNQR